MPKRGPSRSEMHRTALATGSWKLYLTDFSCCFESADTYGTLLHLVGLFGQLRSEQVGSLPGRSARPDPDLEDSSDRANLLSSNSVKANIASLKLTSA